MKHSVRPTHFIILIITLIYSLFAYWAPPVGDDLMFASDYIGVCGSDILSWHGLMANADFLRATDNVRLPNLIAPVLLLGLPKAVIAAIIGLFAAACITLICRLAGRVNAVRLIVVWALTVFLCPWRGNTITTMIGLNVFVPAVFNLLFLIQLSSVCKSRLRKFALVLTALVACTMHEGWSVPVASGLICLALIRRFRLPAEVWTSLGVYLGGIIWLLTAPGMLSRIGNVVATGFNLKLFVTMGLPLVIAACVLASSVVSVKLRHFVTSDAARLTLSAAWCVSVAIGIYSRSLNPNALWITDIMSIALIVAIAGEIVKRHVGQKCGKLIAAGLLTAITAFYINVLSVQHRSCEQHRAIDTLLAESPGGTAFADFDIGLPHSTLLHPVNALWSDFLHIYSANCLEKTKGKGRLIAVVPEVLSHMHADSITPLPGSEGFYDFRGELLADDRPLSYSHWTGVLDVTAVACSLSLTDATGETYDDCDCLAERFTTPDGKHMLWIRPLNARINGPFVQVRGEI